MCATDCGQCGTSEKCYWHQCYNPPVDTSCPTCPLKLSFVSKEVVEGQTTWKVILAVDYQAGSTPARIADVWVYANMDVTLVRVDPGSALPASDKALYTDPITGNAWKPRKDRSFQLLAMSLTNTNPIASGRIATLEFSLDDPGPVPFKLLRHPSLAPEGANNDLDGTPYDSGVVVKK